MWTPESFSSQKWVNRILGVVTSLILTDLAFSTFVRSLLTAKNLTDFQSPRSVLCKHSYHLAVASGCEVGLKIIEPSSNPLNFGNLKKDEENFLLAVLSLQGTNSRLKR